MSWSSRRRLLSAGALLLLLTACGFEPLYGTRGDGGEAAGALAGVRVLPIADRSGQLMHNALRSRLNPQGQPLKPEHELRVILEERVTEASLGRDEAGTRATLRLDARFLLTRADDGTEALRGSAMAMGGYNIVESGFAVDTAERDARRHAIEQVAEDIRRRLAAYFHTAPEQATAD